MRKNHYRMQAVVWLYSGNGAWHFVTLPKKQSDDIKKKYGARKRGWGSLPVRVSVGATSWKTSIFPDKMSGAYVVPLKADVRKKESIRNKQRITFDIEVLA